MTSEEQARAMYRRLYEMPAEDAEDAFVAALTVVKAALREDLAVAERVCIFVESDGDISGDVLAAIAARRKRRAGRTT